MIQLYRMSARVGLTGPNAITNVNSRAFRKL
jgi:hypothetical protein